MNRTLAIGLLAVSFGSTSAAASFPYRAIIQTQEATVRSGPGNEYYGTDILKKGQVVEVFRHVDNRWCAIRPPAGSFSWVLARNVEATDSAELLRVVGSGAKTRVGSHLTQSSNVEYVSLDEKEILKALGSVQRLPGRSQLAYRVQPPSGEFRWIHHRYLERLSDDSSKASDRPTGSGIVRASHQQDDSTVRLEKLPGGSMETIPIPGRVARTTPAASRPMDENAVLLQRRLKTLSARLSNSVSAPVEDWDLAPLRAELEKIVVHSRDVPTRKEATKLLNRLAEFDLLQRRHQLLAASSRTAADLSAQAYRRSSGDARSASKSAGFMPWPILPTTARSATKPRTSFEGEGWLIPVFTKRRDLPSFALTDDDGAILYFVTPRSGLNLRRYLRKRVGIVGSVVSTSPQEQAQLTAQRIVVLDRHRR